MLISPKDKYMPSFFSVITTTSIFPSPLTSAGIGSEYSPVMSTLVSNWKFSFDGT